MTPSPKVAPKHLTPRPPRDVQGDLSPSHGDPKLMEFRRDLFGHLDGGRSLSVDCDVHIPGVFSARVGGRWL